ncbi:V-type proton ATPase subunit E [Cryptococcus neoformans]|nr:V-type proton ATPase subunit E [Cryptococcus neoformans]
MSFFHVVFVAFVIAAIGAAGWFVTPKGKNQTLLRTSLLLTLACCYLMWAITYLCQLHPLISRFFPGYVKEGHADRHIMPSTSSFGFENGVLDFRLSDNALLYRSTTSYITTLPQLQTYFSSTFFFHEA